MTDLRDRVASLFGEIAVRAGAFKAELGRDPEVVFLSIADAVALRDYLRLVSAKDPQRGRLAIVSGLRVRPMSSVTHPVVC